MMCEQGFSNPCAPLIINKINCESKMRAQAPVGGSWITRNTCPSGHQLNSDFSTQWGTLEEERACWQRPGLQIQPRINNSYGSQSALRGDTAPPSLSLFLVPSLHSKGLPVN
jgi:hypothetical protein